MSKCPVCQSTNISTYRHPGAKRWCDDCGFVLQEEGHGVFQEQPCLTQKFIKRDTVVKSSERNDPHAAPFVACRSSEVFELEQKMLELQTENRELKRQLSAKNT